MGRHTITLDDDVEAFLAEEQESTQKAFKTAVNDLLREVRQRRLGDRKRKPSRRYSIKPLSVGRVKHQVVSISDALAFAEGEEFR